jgi:hypothetical protein
MGTGNLKGRLVQYYGYQDYVVYGIVLTEPRWHERWQCDAVHIYWMDDASYTFEYAANLLNPEDKVMALVPQ